MTSRPEKPSAKPTQPTHGPHASSRTAPTRRTLLGAAAWSVPAVVLASAAPAYASSAPALTRPDCLPMAYQLSWGREGAWSYELTGASLPGNGVGQIVAAPVGAVSPGQRLDPLAVTFTNTFHGRMQRAGDFVEGNMVVTSAGVGGTRLPGLEMWQVQRSSTSRSASAVHDDRQTITFDFGRPVTNLSFTITDIDAYRDGSWDRGQYRDAVYVSQPPTSVVRASGVIGSGTRTDPWTSLSEPTRNSAHDNTTSGQGNVRLTYAGPVQSLAVTFYNTETRQLTGNGSQAIYFSDFTFTASSCV